MISKDEVWEVIKELPLHHELGPNGFVVIFKQKALPPTKHDIMSTILILYAGDRRGFRRLNKTLITLISKNALAIELGDFRASQRYCQNCLQIVCA
jgi:hypothetical protein